MKFYLSTSKKFLVENESHNKIYFEFIDNAYTRLLPIKKQVVHDLYNITKNAGQDPGIYINKWFNYADALIIARINNNEVAYTIANYYSSDILFFVSSMIKNEFQNKKIGKLMNFYVLKFFSYWRIKKAIFSPYYYIFRTQNPILYYTWHKYTKMYPKILGGEVPVKEKKIVENFSKKIWPDIKFNSKTFVLKDAYKKYPGLKIKKDQIMWCKDENVNNLFKSNLDINSNSNDALLVMGKISRLNQLYTLLIKNKI